MKYNHSHVSKSHCWIRRTFLIDILGCFLCATKRLFDDIFLHFCSWSTKFNSLFLPEESQEIILQNFLNLYKCTYFTCKWFLFWKILIVQQLYVNMNYTSLQEKFIQFDSYYFCHLCLILSCAYFYAIIKKYILYMLSSIKYFY